MLSHLKGKLHCVMGEHDYYLDLGEYWSKLYGPHYYSFDHKGVHFVVLNSIHHDAMNGHSIAGRAPNNACWRWPGLDNPNGSPFMVGEKQREWLKD